MTVKSGGKQMGYKALDKRNNKIYDVKEWQIKARGVTPYCPVCGEVTELKAASSVVMKTHFAHERDSECPLIENNRSRYAILSPAEQDTKNGNEIIYWTKLNIIHLYNKCREILQGKLKYKEFSEMLERASNKNLWFYKGLTKEVLPYVLIVNYGIFTKGKDSRNEDVHFIFDKDLYGDDLFLHKKITHIWKISSNSDFDEVPIDYNTSNTAPHYVWKYVKSFYEQL